MCLQYAECHPDNEDVLWSLKWHYFGIMKTLLSGQCECTNGSHNYTKPIDALLQEFLRAGKSQLNRMLSSENSLLYGMLERAYQGIYKPSSNPFEPCYPWQKDIPLTLHLHENTELYDKIVIDHEHLVIPWPYFDFTGRNDLFTKRLSGIYGSLNRPSAPNPIENGNGVYVHEVFMSSERLVQGIRDDDEDADSVKYTLLNSEDNDYRVDTFVDYTGLDRSLIPDNFEIKAFDEPSICTRIGSYNEREYYKLFLHIGVRYTSNPYFSQFDNIAAALSENGWEDERINELKNIVEPIVGAVAMEPYSCGALAC